MTPYHIGVALFALSFQIINGIAIGGWLGGYGPTSPSDWSWDGRGEMGGAKSPYISAQHSGQQALPQTSITMVFYGI